MEEAARSGRISILGAPRSLEWVTPVLYVRGQASQLFTLHPAQPGGREHPPADHGPAPGGSPAARELIEAARPERADLGALYIQAQAELRLGHLDIAIDLLDDLLILDPDYPDAAGLRHTAANAAEIGKTRTSTSKVRSLSLNR